MRTVRQAPPARNGMLHASSKGLPCQRCMSRWRTRASLRTSESPPVSALAHCPTVVPQHAGLRKDSRNSTSCSVPRTRPAVRKLLKLQDSNSLWVRRRAHRTAQAVSPWMVIGVLCKRIADKHQQTRTEHAEAAVNLCKTELPQP